MPFIISRDQAHSKLYAVRDRDGDIAWSPNRDKATRFNESAADFECGEINRYSPELAQVEGAKAIDMAEEAA